MGKSPQDGESRLHPIKPIRVATILISKPQMLKTVATLESLLHQPQKLDFAFFDCITSNGGSESSLRGGEGRLHPILPMTLKEIRIENHKY